VTLHLNLDELHRSAQQAGDHCESLATGHLLSGNRIEDARVGWVGTSATALGARLDSWQQESARLLARLGQHAQGFCDAATAAAGTDEAGGTALRELGEFRSC